MCDVFERVRMLLLDGVGEDHRVDSRWSSTKELKTFFGGCIRKTLFYLLTVIVQFLTMKFNANQWWVMVIK